MLSSEHDSRQHILTLDSKQALLLLLIHKCTNRADFDHASCFIQYVHEIFIVCHSLVGITKAVENVLIRKQLMQWVCSYNVLE